MTDIKSEENLQQPGQLIIDELFLTTRDMHEHDLVGHLIELNIYEDVWNPHIHGTVLVNDAINLIGSYGIGGGELITMKLRTATYEDVPDNVIDKSFQVYSINNRSLTTDRAQTYELGFMSIEGISDAAIPISKRYTGNTQDIVEDIYEEYMQEYRRPVEAKEKATLVIGDTPHASNVNYISNFWTPAQNLQYLTKYAQGNQHVGSDFVFYESNKSYYFTSLQQLISVQKEQLFEEYVYSTPGLEVPHRGGGDTFIGINLGKKHCTIEDLKIPRTIDTLDGVDSGYYSQSVRAYDLFTKERIETYVDVREDFESFVHTDDGIPVPSGTPRSPYSQMGIKLLNSFAYGSTPQGIPGGKLKTTNAAVVNNTLFRANYFNSFKDYTFEMDVPGRTDIEVGKLIKLAYPKAVDKPADATYDDIVDDVLTGAYLITAIRHKIDRIGYVMKMEIVKNGLAKSIGIVDDGVNDDIK
jgi:hypothetical protein